MIDDTDYTPWWMRPTPPVPYEWSGRVLTVPESALMQMTAAFQKYARRRREACCFWYGQTDDQGNGQVAAVVLPTQRNATGNYSITGEAMSVVSRATRPYGWRNLAQVHTHPGTWVDHSAYDDTHVNSRQALSLVLPNYGAWVEPWPTGVGVHEFQAGWWHRLTVEQIVLRIRVLPAYQLTQFLDLQ